MIEWYKDKNLEIYFSEKPIVKADYPKPDETKIEKNKISKKPFLLENEICVVLNNKITQRTFNFIIPKNYRWDGATIPRFFWRIVGAKTDSKFLIPSLIHDYLCENHELIDNDRYFSTMVFERLLYVSGLNCFSRCIMKHSTDNFQKFCGWNK